MTSILVVDDLRYNILALTYGLENEGYDVVSAQTGEDAFKKIEENKPDLILLDVVMPEMDGFEVCQKLKHDNDTSDIPVIFISANDSDEYVIKAMKSGGEDYVSKPVRFDVLSVKIQSALKSSDDKQSLQRQNQNLDRMFHKNKLLLDCAGEGILGITAQGDIMLCNRQAGNILGFERSDLESSRLGNILTSVEIAEVLVRGRSDLDVRTEGEMKQSNGSLIPVEYSCNEINDEADGFSGWVFIFQDISARKEAENKLVKMAKYDALTGLANRTLFRETIESAVARTQRNGNGLALLFLDLDHFKSINDNLGHAAGDELLRQVSDSLRQCVRRGDLVSRLGGDEFCVLIYDVLEPHQVVTVAQKILTALSAPFMINGAEIFTSSSIGIALYPDVAEDAEQLVAAADAAMYRAKATGRNNFQFFHSDMQVQLNEQLRIVAALHRAVINKEFEVYYQPQFNLKSRRMEGLEALVRWPNPDFEHVGVQSFIELAEQYGLISEIGQIMLEQVCRQVRDWHRKGLVANDFHVAVNVSPNQLLKDHFAETISEVIMGSGLPLGMLRIEITETAMMNDPERAIKVLESINLLGVGISVDDFGTGYSSLNYLKNLPIDSLKIDRCFVNEIGKSDADESIVKTIIALAENLKLSVVAEGVETMDQLKFLNDAGCELIQGYLIAKPCNKTDIEDLMSNPDKVEPDY